MTEASDSDAAGYCGGLAALRGDERHPGASLGSDLAALHRLDELAVVLHGLGANGRVVVALSTDAGPISNSTMLAGGAVVSTITVLVIVSPERRPATDRNGLEADGRLGVVERAGDSLGKAS